MFRWFCPSTFFFARHHRDTLSSLPPGTRDVAARDSGEERDSGDGEFKVQNPIS